MKIMKINDFLKQIASDIKTTGKILTKDEIYYKLKYIGIKKDTTLVNDIEAFYETFLKSLNNSLVRHITRKYYSLHRLLHRISCKLY